MNAFGLLVCFSALAGCSSGTDSHGAPSTAVDAGHVATDAGEGPQLESAPRATACGLDTGWPGDEQCIKAPDPSKGFQLHFGPANYDDPAEIARYTLGAGEEKLLCTYQVTPNETAIHYDTWLNRLRPRSHHMIVTQVGDGPEEQAVPCEGADGAANQGIIGGNTTTLMPLTDIAPENQGIAKKLPAHARAGMQLHFFNAGTEPILMEAWQNIYYKDEQDVKGESSPIESMAGLGMSVARGTTAVIQGSLTAPQDLRVLDLYSHNHDHTLRFTIFLKRAGETDRTQIYESYDWEHPLLLPLDSIHVNSEGNRDAIAAGGMTGQLDMMTGDALEFECEIRNDDVEKPLRFANEAHTAEMCIMRGDYALSFGKAWASYSM